MENNEVNLLGMALGARLVKNYGPENRTPYQDFTPYPRLKSFAIPITVIIIVLLGLAIVYSTGW